MFNQEHKAKRLVELEPNVPKTERITTIFWDILGGHCRLGSRHGCFPASSRYLESPYYELSEGYPKEVKNQMGQERGKGGSKNSGEMLVARRPEHV